MRPISPKIKKQLLEESDVCARKDWDCSGRITWEHVFIYAGKQINEVWAILKLCEWHHLGDGLNKRENERLAVARATEEDLAKYPKKDWSIYQYENDFNNF